MYVHTRERDSRPGFDGVKIKLLLLLLLLITLYAVYGNTLNWTRDMRMDEAQLGHLRFAEDIFICTNTPYSLQ